MKVYRKGLRDFVKEAFAIHKSKQIENTLK